MITVTDMFCGAGGSTTGATLAGAEVKLAINHWARAIETHNTNYPMITHALTDLHTATPRRFPRTDILIASPECTSHTLAAGKKRTGQQQPALPGLDEPGMDAEAEERSRCTMWTPLDWAEHHGYSAIILENVVDAHLWRPFQAWLSAWKSLEYKYELVYLNSMHAHPTPQSRDRMYFVAWKRKNKRPDLKITPLAHCQRCEKNVDSVQCWKPERSSGKYKQQYVYCCPVCAHEVVPFFYAAASAIDWSLPAPRIGDRSRPLRKKTMQRITDGLQKFAREPFTCNLNHDDIRPVAVETQPFHTQTAYDSTGLVTPPAWLMSYYNNGSIQPVSEPVPTVTTLDRCALITTGELPVVEDRGFRMLVPKEIQAAMAFPAEYVITGTRREQVKQLGNAVTPPVMKLLMQRVITSLEP